MRCFDTVTSENAFRDSGGFSEGRVSVISNDINEPKHHGHAVCVRSSPLFRIHFPEFVFDYVNPGFYVENTGVCAHGSFVICLRFPEFGLPNPVFPLFSPFVCYRLFIVVRIYLKCHPNHWPGWPPLLTWIFGGRTFPIIFFCLAIAVLPYETVCFSWFIYLYLAKNVNIRRWPKKRLPTPKINNICLWNWY